MQCPSNSSLGVYLFPSEGSLTRGLTEDNRVVYSVVVSETFTAGSTVEACLVLHLANNSRGQTVVRDRLRGPGSEGTGRRMSKAQSRFQTPRTTPD